MRCNTRKIMAWWKELRLKILSNAFYNGSHLYFLKKKKDMPCLGLWNPFLCAYIAILRRKTRFYLFNLLDPSPVCEFVFTKHRFFAKGWLPNLGSIIGFLAEKVLFWYGEGGRRHWRRFIADEGQFNLVFITIWEVIYLIDQFGQP